MKRGPEKVLPFSERVYRLLLAAYPAEFRYEYGRDMAQVFRDRCRDARTRKGLIGIIGVWAHTLYDLAVTAPAEHLDTFSQDLRFSARMLRRAPAFTAMVVLTLAIGIGANSAIFSIVNTVLLTPLPGEEPERVMMIFEQSGEAQTSVAPSNFLAWREQSQVFEDMAAFVGQSFNLTGSGNPEMVEGSRVSASLFPLLRVTPQLGRVFTAEEDRPGYDRVVILGHDLWQRRFSSDPNIIGQPITISGDSFTVIGVMRRAYSYPLNSQLWTPIALDASGMNGLSGRILQTIGRLKPGVTHEQAQENIGAIAARMEQANPGFNKGVGAAVVPITELAVRGFKSLLLILLGVVGFVLLISCANVANLLLARAAARQKEIAIRIALGAGRSRLIRLLLTESVLLSLIGGVCGLLLALWAVPTLVALSPGSIPRSNEISVDGRVLGFTFVISLVTGIAFGLIPALQASRPDLNESLKEAARSSPAAFGRNRLRSVLVVLEVSLSLILLIGAGLMIRSFLRLQAVDPGFNPKNLVTMQMTLPESRYGENDLVVNFYREVLQRTAALPGVESAGTAHLLPLGSSSTRGLIREGQPPPEPGKVPVVNYRVISPGYFHTLQIPLLAGRAFTDQDAINSPGSVIINETLARRYFPGEDPLGKRIKHRDDPEDPWLTIVGVAGDVRQGWLGDKPEPEAYWSYAQAPLLRSPTVEQRRRMVNLIVRTTADPESLLSAVRKEVATVDKELPVSNVRTMESRIEDSVSPLRYNALLIGIFASIAVALAAVGIYGVISYSISHRTHEIGIRMAMGAQASDILKLILRQGMRLALLGIAIGLIAAFALTRLIARLLYEVSATDPLTFLNVSFFLFIVSLVACVIPARRATKVSPMVALRHE